MTLLGSARALTASALIYSTLWLAGCGGRDTAADDNPVARVGRRFVGDRTDDFASVDLVGWRRMCVDRAGDCDRGDQRHGNNEGDVAHKNNESCSTLKHQKWFQKIADRVHRY